MELEDVMAELERLGSAQTRSTLAKHGAPENLWGVKVGDMKPIAKRIKGDQGLALALYRTGQPDTMYLAGLVADGRVMEADELRRWAHAASWSLLSEYTVASVAAESPHARTLALEWIASPLAHVASSGWSTYSGLVAVAPDADLDLDELRGLLRRVRAGIHEAPNRVRYCMNGFVITVGCYVTPLVEDARDTARAIGTVRVDVGKTACQVPEAEPAIDKVASMGRLGRKRKTMRC